MNKTLKLFLLLFLLVPVCLAAKPLDSKIAQSIQITDLIIRAEIYDYSKCGPHVCEVLSTDGITSLKLVRKPLLESLEEKPGYYLKIIIEGSVLSVNSYLEFPRDKKTIIYDNNIDGRQIVRPEVDPVIFKILAGWLNWLLDKPLAEASSNNYRLLLY
ncbi:MAG: hypothetical protein H8E38_12490 [SAR324 cluster bacterium]|nr:hypothetical protein [SAR324 cluster bacterium]MBL7036001.1 hypothetical protein [SAR324 cluster bacterium]